MKKNLTSLNSKLEQYTNLVKGLTHKQNIKTPSVQLGKALLTALPISGAMLAATDASAALVPGNKFQIGAGPIQSIMGSSTTLGNLNLGTDRFIVFTNVAGGANHRFDLDVIGNAFIINPTNANDRIAGFGAGGYNYVDAFADNLTTNAWCGTAGFINETRMYLYYPGAANDEWTIGTIYKLGVRMQEGGQNYFGWIRLRLDQNTPPAGATYYGTGYESTPNSCAILPVELLSFKSNATKNDIQLSWQTASEIDNAGFEIQRSENGKEFKTLAFIEGKGNSLEHQEYYFDDKNLHSGQLYYYRLKQVDFGGNFEYSEVITAELIKEDEITARFSPNPISAGFTALNYTTNETGQLYLQVFDVNGKLLFERIETVSAGTNELNLDLQTLATGIYFVKLEQNGIKKYERLVVE